MSEKKFQKKVEDFVCEHCGVKVKGNGYTNHCPKCLYSKHVDENPGDRLSPCQGLMVPVEIITRKQKHFIKHVCFKCHLEKINKVADEDDFEAVLKIIKDNEFKHRQSKA